MNDLFKKYGNRKIGLYEVGMCKEITLNELKEALYADFKERYDREKKRVCAYHRDYPNGTAYRKSECDCFNEPSGE